MTIIFHNSFIHTILNGFVWLGMAGKKMVFGWKSGRGGGERKPSGTTYFFFSPNERQRRCGEWKSKDVFAIRAGPRFLGA